MLVNGCGRGIRGCACSWGCCPGGGSGGHCDVVVEVIFVSVGGVVLSDVLGGRSGVGSDDMVVLV